MLGRRQITLTRLLCHIELHEVGTLAIDGWAVTFGSWYSEEGTGRGRNARRPLLAVPNVTAHPSTASVPITVLLYERSVALQS